MSRTTPRSRPRRPARPSIKAPARRRTPAARPGPAARSRSVRGPVTARFAGRPRRLAAGDRRSQILAAALEVFSERGFHGTRTHELATRAGVSEALVFRHFPTKQALIRAILDRVGFEDRILVLEERLRAMPPRDALLLLAEQVLTNLREHPDVFRVVFYGLLETPELAGHFYQTYLSRLLALETRLFRRAYAARRGAPRGDPSAPVVVARSFHGSLMYYNLACTIIRMEPMPEGSRALARAIVNIYLPEEIA